MVSSKTLKSFVKMHEYKLNAKINGLRAEQLESEVEPELHHGTHSLSGSAEHWNLSEASRNRPKSRYFDFILTTTHQ
jgi:hypothetical protein